MRLDIVEHLDNFGMKEEFLENVIFNEDISQEWCFDEIESVAIIDFNQLPKEFEADLSGKIHYICDHHVDSNLYLDTLKSEKEVQLLGSCSTLVAQKMIEKTYTKVMDSDLALFLSAPISLDTLNFDEFFYGSKWVDLDKEIFGKLRKENKDLNEDPAKYWKHL